MKTTVKNTKKGTTSLTSTIKRHLIAVVESGNKKYFGVRLKVNRTKMMIEELGNNEYKVTEFVNQPDIISGGTYETKLVYNVIVTTR